MKNALRVISIVVVAAILFGIGYGVGAKKGIQVVIKNDTSSSSSGSSATVNTNTAPVSTTAPTTQPETTQGGATSDDTKKDDAAKDDTKKDDTKKDDAKKDDAKKDDTSKNAVPSTPAEVVAKYNEVVNAAKKEQNLSIHKTQNISLECTSCSVSFLKSAVTSLLGTFMKPVDETYEISGGVDSQGKTTTDFIMPQHRDAELPADGAASATATASGDGYVMNITVKSETSSFDGTNTVNPTYHESAMIPLNLATLELPAGAKISSATMSYPGATIEATVNGSGKLTKIVLHLPMEGEGTGGYNSISLSVGVKGYMDETYEFSYK